MSVPKAIFQIARAKGRRRIDDSTHLKLPNLLCPIRDRTWVSPSLSCFSFVEFNISLIPMALITKLSVEH